MVQRIVPATDSNLLEPIGYVGRLCAVGILQTESLTSALPDVVTFDDLYASQWLPMVRFASLTTGSFALAEEIVQDAFVELHRRWDRVERPHAYLRCAVSHRCTSWVRRQRLERRSPPDAPGNHTDESLLEMLDALKVLSPRQRAAVVLRYHEGLSEAEIAGALSCRPGTVKSLLARALDRLRKELEHDNRD